MSAHTTIETKPLGNIQALTISQKYCIGICGAFGGLLATLGDLVQKQDASAVMKIRESLATTLKIPLPALLVMFFLVIFAVALCFVFTVDSYNSAFYRGASIIAILMTVMPYQVLPTIPTEPNQVLPVDMSGGFSQWLVPHVFAQAPSRPIPQFRIDVLLTTSDGKKVPSAVYSLNDPVTGAVIARSKVQGETFWFYTPSRDCVLRVEVPGYSIAERRLTVKASQRVTIALASTLVPLSVQRVLH